MYIGKYSEVQELIAKVGEKDIGFVERRLAEHVSERDSLASLRSRCVCVCVCVCVPCVCVCVCVCRVCVCRVCVPCCTLPV